MSNKTYNQYCSIAHALDIVGDRWTMVIIRNLLIGPKRFSDLLKGLPGISTNILTDRLKLLEDNGVITTRYLPPPAASTVYELTGRGYGLVDVLTALARWGSHTLGAPQPGQYIVNEAIAFMVQGAFLCDTYPSATMNCNLYVQDDLYDYAFGVRITKTGAVVQEMVLPEADVRMFIGLEALSELSSVQVRLQTLIEQGRAHLDGSSEAINAMVHWIDTRSAVK